MPILANKWAMDFSPFVFVNRGLKSMHQGKLLCL